MRFAVGNVGFELRVTGYEFPDNTTDSVNWLFIEGAVRHPNGDWQFRHPSLRTREVAWLADWLEAVAAGAEPDECCRFNEPNLTFEVASTGKARVLRVSFSAEARPPWIGSGIAQVEFPAEELDLGSAVASLRRQLLLWPERPEAADENPEPDTTTDGAGA